VGIVAAGKVEVEIVVDMNEIESNNRGKEMSAEGKSK
jgi:hypothetical protein